MNIRDVIIWAIGAAGVLMGTLFFIAPATPEQQHVQQRTVRITLEAPEQLASRDYGEGLFGRFRSWIGARSRTIVRPDPGTKFTVNSSAYAPSPYQTDATPCITASGNRVRPGTVASNFLPLGTIVDINGERYIVEDRMNPRYDGYYLDIWFPSTSSALEFGRQQLEITIVEYAKPGDEIREVEAEAEAEAEEDDSFIAGIRDRMVTIGQTFANLIQSRVNPSVNQYDVDCLTDSNQEE